LAERSMRTLWLDVGLAHHVRLRLQPVGVIFCDDRSAYTGVTRGKRLVVLVGQKKAVAIAVRSVSGRHRWSKLREWLCPCLAANFR